jgi:hypothetical protein
MVCGLHINRHLTPPLFDDSYCIAGGWIAEDARAFSVLAEDYAFSAANIACEVIPETD